MMHCNLRAYTGSCNPLNRYGRPLSKIALVKRSETAAGSILSSPSLLLNEVHLPPPRFSGIRVRCKSQMHKQRYQPELQEPD